MDEIKSRCNFS